jgi:hypothetical protein
MDMKNKKSFFTLDTQRKKKTVKALQVKSDFVYHTLEYYGLEEVHMPSIPNVLLKMNKNDPFRMENAKHNNTNSNHVRYVSFHIEPKH